MRTSKIIPLVIAMIVIALFGGEYMQFPNVKTATSRAPDPLSEETLTSLSTSTATWYKVVRVVDGDTLVVLVDSTEVTVRLIGINTPEVVDPRRPVECFGREASAEAKKVMGGRDVRLELDPSQGTYDKYGRLLAYVYVPADVDPRGILINKYMIAEGYAHEYTYNLPYHYQSAFKAAEDDARLHERGLWSPDTCGGNTSIDSSPT